MRVGAPNDGEISVPSYCAILSRALAEIVAIAFETTALSSESVSTADPSLFVAAIAASTSAKFAEVIPVIPMLVKSEIVKAGVTVCPAA